MFSMFNGTPEESEVKKQGKIKAFLRSRSDARSMKTEERDAVEDGMEIKDKRSGLFNSDKSQKAVIYTQFSDDPKAVIMVKTENCIPEITDSYDVVVKVQASTVSYADCLLRRGMSFDVIEPVCCPATPGMDVIGYIVSKGENVTKWQEGDRVAALVQIGGNARYAVISSKSLISVPRSLDPAEAVCMVTTYMTAYQSLKLVIGKQRNLEGKKVLVTGALGPTGQALVQMAKRAGADAVFATAPSKMHRYVRSVLGASPLPMEPAEWLPEVKGSMDVVLDGVCQDGFASPRAALSSKGTLVCVGMAALMNSESMGVFGAPMSARWTNTKASWFMSRTKVYDVVSSFNNDPQRFKTDLEHVFQLLRQRDIKPHISKRVCLSEVADAHVYLELGKSRGAIVCMPWRRRVPGTGVRAGKYGTDDEDREEERD